jgi:hypothetical protein
MLNLMVRSASSRVSNHEAPPVLFILRDAAQAPLLRMRADKTSAARETLLPLPADFLGKGVAQANGAVEYRLAGRGILVAHEIALPLELHHLAGIIYCD